MSDLKSRKGCVSETHVLYAFYYTHEVPVRTFTCGGMDSEFSHMERRQGVFHVVAPTLELAKASYEFRRPQRVYVLQRFEEICVLDAFVNVGGIYGGRWIS